MFGCSPPSSSCGTPNQQPPTFFALILLKSSSSPPRPLQWVGIALKAAPTILRPLSFSEFNAERNSKLCVLQQDKMKTRRNRDLMSVLKGVVSRSGYSNR